MAMLAICSGDSHVDELLSHQAISHGIHVTDSADVATASLLIRKRQLILCEGETVLWMVALPCRLHDIMHRIIQWHHTVQSDVVILNGTWSLNKRERLLTAHHAQCELTEKETDVMAYLANLACIENVDVEATKDYMMHALWGYHPEAESRTFDTHLYRLRQKLEPLGENAPEILVNNGRYVLK